MTVAQATAGRAFALAFAVAGRTFASAAAQPVVTLTGGKSRLFKMGNPLVFSGAVHKVHGNPGAGDIVDVHDGAGGRIGWGMYNPHSLYRVRLLAHVPSPDAEHRDVGALLATRLNAAAARRDACRLPSESTTAYRLCNSEGDRISGLVVDVFNNVAVVVSSAFWLELHVDAVTKALLGLRGIERVIWRRADARLKQDGWPPALEAGGEAGGEGAVGEGDDGAADDMVDETVDETEVVLESGLKFEVSLLGGQKSGFYCDQRDNRAAVAALCRGKRMLDLFCYSGGFSLAAAAAGAAEALGVDSSGAALSLARRNAQLNGVEGVTSFLQADIFYFLENGGLLQRDESGQRQLAEGGAPRGWDVVICDPPKFAPSVRDLQKATRKYRKLNGLAMRALKPGGLLVSCTCSAAMSQSGTFLQTLQEAAEDVGRTITLVSESGAARDHMLHPAVMESRYLTCLMLVVD